MAARAAAQREAAKTDPGVALMLKKKRTAIRKMLATRAAKKAAAALAEPSPEKAAADAAEHELLDTIQAGQPDPPLTLRGTPRKTPEEVLAMKRRIVAKARAAMAQKRADGTYKSKPKVWSNTDPSTLGGRIDLMLAKLGKKRGELEHAIADTGNGFVAGLHRNPTWGMRRERAVLVAGFLGVSVEWLLDGGDAPAEPAALIPHAATVLKANGKHHPVARGPHRARDAGQRGHHDHRAVVAAADRRQGDGHRPRGRTRGDAGQEVSGKTDIKIEKGVPLPVRNNRSGLMQILRNLKIGDSFVYPMDARTGVYGMAKSVGIKVTARYQADGTVRVWRIK